jgi:isoprenylcysteine carboxyl methyltransferase (ICMT) family protein YpbQ
MNHPNYLVVIIEIALYPALFGLWFTAILFGTANIWLLKKRIEGEDRALRSLSQTAR